MKLSGSITLLFCLTIAGTVAAAPQLGLQLRDVDFKLAEHLGIDGGAYVLNVLPGSPAEKAGIERYDVIVSWNDAAIASAEDLATMVNKKKAGAHEYTVGLIRKGTRLQKKVTLTGKADKPKQPKILKAEPKEERGYLGIFCTEVPPVIVQFMQLGGNHGVMIERVFDKSAAAKGGLQKGDLIVAVNGRPVKSLDGFLKTMHGKKAGAELSVKGLRAGKPFTKKIVLGEKPDIPRQELKAMPQLNKPPFPPKIRKFQRDHSTLRFKDPSGKEHVIPIPDMFKGYPDFDQFQKQFKQFKPHEFDNLKEQIDQAMGEARERLKNLSKDMESQHHKFMKKLQQYKQNASENDADEQIIRKSISTQVMTHADGTYQITIKTENGDKTVTVKKAGKTVAEDLPYDKINTLPEDVQNKIKEFESSVKINVITSPAENAPVPEKKKLKINVPSIKL